ncbi:hypothetical protein CCMA1212_005952 [Trichoderma ghanense]|uniref:Uncharacterized protein n=1 Tax=Trichoderma ghanense TaxID=65468 RepID=A0ABY2H235_9HYPO
MCDADEMTIKKMEKGWAIATRCSEERLRRVHGWDEEQLGEAVRRGLVLLETVCVFVHGCIKSGQFKLPVEFWKILHFEYGIVVYPSALTECMAPSGLGTSQTFAEIYSSHIVMLWERDSDCPPRCPFEFLTEPLPLYEQ